MPERLLDLELDERAGTLAPRYLTTRDHGWVERLLLELEACEGIARTEVKRRLSTLRASDGRRAKAEAAMGHWLLRRRGFVIQAACSPPALRAALFLTAGRAPDSPQQAIVSAAARELAIAPEHVGRDLYADLPGARRLAAPKEQPSVIETIEGYNLTLAQSLLLRAQRLEVELDGNLKAVLRFARLQRLLCLAEARAGEGLASGRISLSGPLSLFRQTTKYGHLLARWLPALLRAPRWNLRARCLLGGREHVWAASYLDPLASSHAPVAPFDSALERRLFRDLRRVAPAWGIERESALVQLGAKIACADFTLIAPGSGARVPVEVVGYWTERYLRDKLAVLAALPTSAPWIVCLDEQLADRAEGLGAAALATPVFLFRRRIDAAALIAFVERQLGANS